MDSGHDLFENAIVLVHLSYIGDLNHPAPFVNRQNVRPQHAANANALHCLAATYCQVPNTLSVWHRVKPSVLLVKRIQCAAGRILVDGDDDIANIFVVTVSSGTGRQVR